MLRLLLLTFIALNLFTDQLFSKVKTHGLFTSGAVLQRGIKIPIFGSAADGEVIIVEFAGEVQKTIAKNGKWIVYFKPRKAGGPYQLIIKGENRIVLENIMIGDVWVCSGQSNMQYYFYQYYKKYAHIIGDDPKTYKNSQIRIIKVKPGASDKKEDEVILGKNNSHWKELDPKSARFFSATSYYFGVHLQEKLNVPIGLILSCLSATAIEYWTPKSVLESKVIIILFFSTSKLLNVGPL